MGQRIYTVQQTLERAYVDYHSKHSLKKDPLYYVHKFKDLKDQEISGFIVSLLAYGNVKTILKSIRAVFHVLEPSPIRAITCGFIDNPLPDFRHRFTTGEDLWIIFEKLKTIYLQWNSLENFFLSKQPPNLRMKSLITSFIDNFWKIPIRPELTKVVERRFKNLKYLLPDPRRGSACKRINLFLRWMVRPRDGIDLGVWTKIQPHQLILPIDTHILKVLKDLNWTKSRVATWRLAENMTNRLKYFDPLDPVRFDFSLCHLSMNRSSIKSILSRFES